MDQVRVGGFGGGGFPKAVVILMHGCPDFAVVWGRTGWSLE